MCIMISRSLLFLTTTFQPAPKTLTSATRSMLQLQQQNNIDHPSSLVSLQDKLELTGLGGLFHAASLFFM